jgi:hypothetical protein
VKTVGAVVGLVIIAWSLLTPTLAMYAVGYPQGDRVFNILTFVLTVGVLFVFLHPKGPLFIANKAAGLAVRIALGPGLVALLVANGLPVWAVMYAVVATVAFAAVRRAPAIPAAPVASE